MPNMTIVEGSSGVATVAEGVNAVLTANEELKLKKDAASREIMDLRVFVVGGGHQYVKMFFDAGFKGARSVEDADIVCFTGGSDVTPSYYGEEALPGTHFDKRRDEVESYIYGECLGLKKAMVGICRGGQFLNVMNDGKLWQDVDNHAIRDKHDVIDKRTGEVKANMTSTHHQMMIPAVDAKVIAVANLSCNKKAAKMEWHGEPKTWQDVEVVWYDGTNSLCFQPHPEFQNGECRNYFLDLVDEFILPAC